MNVADFDNVDSLNDGTKGVVERLATCLLRLSTKKYGHKDV